MMYVSINSSWNANDSGMAVVLQEVVSQVSTISQGVGSPNHNQTS